jgi:hypothetical protein
VATVNDRLQERLDEANIRIEGDVEEIHRLREELALAERRLIKLVDLHLESQGLLPEDARRQAVLDWLDEVLEESPG